MGKQVPPQIMCSEASYFSLVTYSVLIYYTKYQYKPHDVYKSCDTAPAVRVNGMIHDFDRAPLGNTTRHVLSAGEQ